MESSIFDAIGIDPGIIIIFVLGRPSDRPDLYDKNLHENESIYEKV